MATSLSSPQSRNHWTFHYILGSSYQWSPRSNPYSTVAASTHSNIQSSSANVISNTNLLYHVGCPSLVTTRCIRSTCTLLDSTRTLSGNGIGRNCHSPTKLTETGWIAKSFPARSSDFPSSSHSPKKCQLQQIFLILKLVLTAATNFTFPN
jgi:hypothetical protein